ncbi:MAG: hypothetical protein JXO22_04415 [Phycisphaerae bacterium]|nr:hypothetical protein [Phycisphaerae bacterium]
MALTITNPNTLTLLNIVNRTSDSQSDTMTRLSTGSRINKGSDDPAGLIAMRAMDTELTAVNAALSNNQRTDAMLGVADNAMTEIASMLDEIQSLAQQSTNSAGLTASELSANQAQIDNALAAIDRIVSTTEFNGKNLLDGSLGINVTAPTSAVTDVQVYSRETSSSNATLTVSRTAAAEKATFQLATGSATEASEIAIQGEDGSAVISIASGDTMATIASKINAATGETGVTASATSTSLNLLSSDYGSDAFVRVSVISGADFSNNYDAGVDAGIKVNGQVAAVDGLNVSFSSGDLSMSFNITEDYGTTATVTDKTLTVSSQGGATFQLGTNSNTRQTIGINGIYSSQLGSGSTGYLSQLKSGGSASLLNDPSAAAQIAKAASQQVATAQGRLGGFQKFQVQTSINALNATEEGLTSARSTIADADYAADTAELNNQSVLLQAAISLLGLANQQSSQILSLL